MIKYCKFIRVIAHSQVSIKTFIIIIEINRHHLDKSLSSLGGIERRLKSGADHVINAWLFLNVEEKTALREAQHGIFLSLRVAPGLWSRR